MRKFYLLMTLLLTVAFTGSAATSVDDLTADRLGLGTSYGFFESNNVEMINALKNQNTLLMQMLEVLMAERTVQVDNTITLDGRSIAKGTAKFIEKEISNLNKRANRISGLAY